jgi:Zn-dependent metalloprotease
LSAHAEIRRDPASGVVSYAKADDLAGALVDDPTYRRARERQDVGAMALRFLSAYRDEFLIVDPPSEFQAGPVATDALGFRRVRLRQVWKGLTVVDAELSLQFNDALALTLLQGRYIPTPQVAPEDATLSSEDAGAIAANELGQGVQLTEPDLVIYPLPTGRGVLAYQVIGAKGLTERHRITIDAGTGETLAKEPLRYP